MTSWQYDQIRSRRKSAVSNLVPRIASGIVAVRAERPDLVSLGGGEVVDGSLVVEAHAAVRVLALVVEIPVLRLAELQDDRRAGLRDLVGAFPDTSASGSCGRARRSASGGTGSAKTRPRPG
jgi:hypothetical protein